MSKALIPLLGLMLLQEQTLSSYQATPMKYIKPKMDKATKKKKKE